MLVQDAQAPSLEIELRQQANYWRAQHARAVGREAAWKGKAQRLAQVVLQQQAQITGGLQRIGELLQPIYTRILERSRAANHWKMDEMCWLVFEEVEGKDSYRWWLWVVITDDTVAYLLEPTRSAKVPSHHLGEDPTGIINADRYSVCKWEGCTLFVDHPERAGERSSTKISE